MSRIKNLLLIALVLCVASCSACAKPEQTAVDAAVPPPIPEPVQITSVIANNDNLEITLPNDGWQESGSFGHMKVFENSLLRNKIILTKNASLNTYEQMILNVVRGIKDAGGVVSSLLQVQINGHKFTAIDSSKDGMQVLMWLALEKGFNYTVLCGAPEIVHPHDICLAIANSIKIN